MGRDTRGTRGTQGTWATGVLLGGVGPSRSCVHDLGGRRVTVLHFRHSEKFPGALGLARTWNGVVVTLRRVPASPSHGL